MLITTMNDLPGGGELKGMTKNGTSELGTSWTEVRAYGTACKVTKS